MAVDISAKKLKHTVLNWSAECVMYVDRTHAPHQAEQSQAAFTVIK